MAYATRDGSREQYWRGYLTCWEASGLLVRDFCEFHDLSQQSFVCVRGPPSCDPCYDRSVAERGCTMAYATRDGSREQYWRGYLTLRREASGLSVRDFCEFHDFRSRASTGGDGRSLTATRPSPSSCPCTSSLTPSRQRQPDGGAVESLEGRLVRIRPGFDPQTLVRVVELLEAGGRPC